MGRYYYNTKQEADYLKQVDTSFLNKHEYFQGFKRGTISWGEDGDSGSISVEVNTLSNSTPYARFMYTQTDHEGEKESYDYKTPLTSTPCNYGGKRWWFRCPLARDGVPCGRRVGTLYLGNPYFGCRHCLDLTYKSRNKSRPRGVLGLYFEYFDLAQKLEEIGPKLRTIRYAGKPTKRFMKYLQLQDRAEQLAQIVTMSKL